MINEIPIDIAYENNSSVYELEVIFNLDEQMIDDEDSLINVDMEVESQSPVYLIDIEADYTDINMDNDVSIVVVHGDADPYEGPYIVDPLVASNLVLGTSDKYCRSDITVNKVPRHSTSNESGITFYIGEG